VRLTPLWQSSCYWRPQNNCGLRHSALCRHACGLFYHWYLALSLVAEHNVAIIMPRLLVRIAGHRKKTRIRIVCWCCRLQPGTWLRAIDFGCAQPVQEGESLTRKTGTPMFMVRLHPFRSFLCASESRTRHC